MAIRGRTVGFWESVSVILGLLGWGIQTRFPEQKWIGSVVLVTAGLMAFGFLVWWIAQHLAIKEYEREHPPSSNLTPQIIQTANHRNEFNPSNVVNVHVPVTQQQQRSQRHTPERPPPTFEATDNARIVTYGLDGRTGILFNEHYYGDENDLPSYMTLVNCALAQFHYCHEANVEPRLWLAAHIYPYSKNQLPLKPVVYHAVWSGADFAREIEVAPGKVFDLIVALFKRQGGQGVVLYEQGTGAVVQDYVYGSDTVFRPTLLDVAGTDFFIKIELAPKCWNDDPLPKQEFWFRLILGEPPEFAKLDRSPLDVTTDMKMAY